MTRPTPASALLIVALATLAAAPRLALAQPAAAAAPEPTAPELATARLLFAEALAAQDQGRCAEAVAIYQRIAKITVSPVLYLRIGTCHESLGHVVEAINAFELATQEAEKKRDTAVATEARAHLARLRPKVAHLAVQVPADAEGIAIILDDRPVSAALAGATMVVDPGRRHVVVRASNYERAFEADVAATAEQPSTVTADLGKKKAIASVSAAVIAPAPLASKPVAEPVKAPPPEPAANRIPGAIAGGVTGAVGLGALISGLIAHAKFDEFVMENANPRAGSLAGRQRLRDSGEAAALASTVLTGVFIAGAGVTAYLLVNPPRRSLAASAARRPALAPWIAATGGGVVVRGDL